MTKIKICGLSRDEDISFVNEAKPDYCGFIIHFPKSHRNVTPDRARELIRGLDRSICPVGVFVNEPMETILSLTEDGTLGAVQLHGQESTEYVEELKEKLRQQEAAASADQREVDAPAGQKISGCEGGRGRTVTLIQAFKILSAEDVKRAGESAADYILLDQGAGGTGETFDWSLVPAIKRPWFLAGGLTPENVAEALNVTIPYGVDVSSGVETDRVKDYHKIKSFIQNVRSYEENKGQPTPIKYKKGE